MEVLLINLCFIDNILWKRDSRQRNSDKGGIVSIVVGVHLAILYNLLNNLFLLFNSPWEIFIKSFNVIGAWTCINFLIAGWHKRRCHTFTSLHLSVIWGLFRSGIHDWYLWDNGNVFRKSIMNCNYTDYIKIFKW
jgi:hypothetical protein